MKTSLALLAVISVSAVAMIGFAEARSAAFHDFDSAEW